MMIEIEIGIEIEIDWIKDVIKGGSKWVYLDLI